MLLNCKSTPASRSLTAEVTEKCLCTLRFLVTGRFLQVADAEAATARLVAQITESSPKQDHRPLQLVAAHRAGDVRCAHNTKDGQQQQQLQQLQQQQHQHSSSDRENEPEVQQHPGKRRGIAQSGHAAAGTEEGGKKQQAKRRKVSKDKAPVHPPAVEGGPSSKDDGLPPDAKEIVGRPVQQQFEAGVFKVDFLS